MEEPQWSKFVQKISMLQYQKPLNHNKQLVIHKVLLIVASIGAKDDLIDPNSYDAEKESVKLERSSIKSCKYHLPCTRWAELKTVTPWKAFKPILKKLVIDVREYNVSCYLAYIPSTTLNKYAQWKEKAQ